MKCPDCGADVADPNALFCSRCGASLAAEEAEATERLATPPASEDPSTTELGPGEPAVQPLLSDYAEVLRGRFLASWLDPLAAACLAFLILLALGALLLVAAKLQYPGFGAGANPIEVLGAIVILGLAILRVPVHVDELVVSVLPLGALLSAGMGVAWATSVTLRSADSRRFIHGAAVGVPFGILCWIAALVFRFGGHSEVFAGAWGSLFWGLLWGAVFGALGAWLPTRDRRGVIETITAAGGGSAIRRGIAAAAIALVAAGLLGGVATLLWVIVGLVRGAPGPQFALGDAAAAFVYLLAFGPNVIVTLTALGMGAPIYVGARVTVAGSVVGNVRRIWLLGDAPGYTGFLILIPAISCSLAGFWARRVSKRDELVPVVTTFALVFASVLGALAWLGEARLGASLLGRGLAQLDVNAPATFALGGLWAAVMGSGGWVLADRAAAEDTG